MSLSSSLLSEDLFQCTVCLDVFTQPVSLPCGHTFCLSCVQTQWMTTGSPHCPKCLVVFQALPELRENSFADEMARQIREEKGKTTTGCRGSQVALCDLCPAGKPLRAVKSCLVCLVSYCEQHVVSHVARFTKHTLVQPWHHLEERMCKKHERPLELFCRYDQTCVCVLCTDTEHESHHAVPVEREWAERKTKLLKSQSDIKQMIEQRLKKTNEIKQSIQMSKENTEREIAHSIEVFTVLVHCIERGQAELVKVMEEKQKAAERQAEDLIKELEIEVTKLKVKDSELEQLIQSEDYLHLLQEFPSLSPVSHTKDWSRTRVSTMQCLGLLREAVTHTEELLRIQMHKVTARELEAISQYEVDLTLDPSTANPWLEVYADGKCVKDGNVEQKVPDDPRRFDTVPCVLAREPMSRGRSYWEVEVANKTAWDLGVARHSVNRKGLVTLSPKDGYWAICLRRGREYRACDCESVLLSLRIQPQRIAIFVSYEDGQVSFYDPVSQVHIFSFTGQHFTESLLAFFNPDVNDSGNNRAPLIIRPVRHQANKITYVTYVTYDSVTI
ncbi:E3 ubiquitin-protein ligase TRIM39 isoform X1 [Colossoma macropomum]|uniref:E3 ubiquitin-protein ligase TRIM39 isoform X1 n=2 Tax=Colossoma macropomum TaxID=42526 RepID=UPI001863F06C|nr:E3 ubiquitin-protein ligase TRIM39 isoform X1 [Colossoma macropomum]